MRTASVLMQRLNVIEFKQGEDDVVIEFFNEITLFKMIDENTISFDICRKQGESFHRIILDFIKFHSSIHSLCFDIHILILFLHYKLSLLWKLNVTTLSFLTSVL